MASICDWKVKNHGKTGSAGRVNTTRPHGMAKGFWKDVVL